MFRDYPLPMHQQAQISAEAAQCARDQGKFWEYHDVLFANQSKLQENFLKQYAADLGMDADAFNQCLDSGKHRETVSKDHEDGTAAGVSGTPAFFVNGRFLNGAKPFEDFQKIIDEELSRGQ